MRYVKSIVPILVQNYFIFGGSCSPNKKKTIEEEKKTEINTSDNEDDKKNLIEQQKENSKKIEDVKNQEIKLKTVEKIKEELKNEKKITIEPPKGDIKYDEIIREFQKEVDEGEKKEEKTISTESKKIKELQEEFDKSPMKGLQNIGSTCYMNATLQCFANIKKFVEYFKYNDNDIFTDKKTLSYSFKEVIDHLWDKNPKKRYYEPYDFKEKISNLNPLFQGNGANDAKDLIQFLIMTLHEELNPVKKPVNVVETNFLLDQRNRFLMLSNFVETFKKDNRSVISDLFYAMNCNTVKCGNCNIYSYNYQTYFFLVFPLEEIRKHNINECLSEYINNNLNYSNNACYYNLTKYNNAFYNSIVDIFDCFEYDRKTNTMSGQNAMYCNYCKQTVSSLMCTNLITGPEVLIIILNRGKGKEFKVKLIFSEDLDLSKYIYHKASGVRYKLKGVITHLGENGQSGHFIAFCKDPITGNWNQFNDATVTPVKNFKKDVIDFGMPYLLFYEKVKS